MASHSERKAIIQECMLDRLKGLFGSGEGTTTMASEVGRAVIKRLPSSYDAAAVRSTVEAATDVVISTYKARWRGAWPPVSMVAEAVAQEVADRKDLTPRMGAEPSDPKAHMRRWKEIAEMLEAYGASGMLSLDGPALEVLLIDGRFNQQRRYSPVKSVQGAKLARALAAHWERQAYGDPRDRQPFDWAPWEIRERGQPEERMGHTVDDWTLEGARERIARVEAELRGPIDPKHAKTCMALLGIAREAERRTLARSDFSG